MLHAIPAEDGHLSRLLRIVLHGPQPRDPGLDCLLGGAVGEDLPPEVRRCGKAPTPILRND